jgi:hypothetical protein
MLTEFGRFISSLRESHVSHTIKWELPKEEFQSLISNAGFNITSLGCASIYLAEDDCYYVFCKGEIDLATGECAVGKGLEAESGRFLLKVHDGTKNVTRRTTNFKMEDLPHMRPASNPAEECEKLIRHWEPTYCYHDPGSVRLLRAFLNAVACVASQREALEGKEPLRSLDSFPQTAYPKNWKGIC